MDADVGGIGVFWSLRETQTESECHGRMVVLFYLMTLASAGEQRMQA
jgi:hypothetical protein